MNIKTKFKPGDLVWTMHENKPIRAIVKVVKPRAYPGSYYSSDDFDHMADNIKETEQHLDIFYDILFDQQKFNRSMETRKEEELYKSKKWLIESL